MWNSLDCSSSSEDEADTGVAAVAALSDTAARQLAGKLKLVQKLDPAIRAALDLLPASEKTDPHKHLTLEVLDEWAALEKENTKKPDPLQFTYASLCMADTMLYILESLLHQKLNAIASRALSTATKQLESRLA